MVARAGAGPWPQITSVRPRLISCTMIGTSPPGPFRCGSTTCNVKAVATPASKALPPFSSVAIPTAGAIQGGGVQAPNVPSISGLVVNGSGLMLLMKIHHSAWASGWGALDHRVGLLPTRDRCSHRRDQAGAGAVLTAWQGAPLTTPRGSR